MTGAHTRVCTETHMETSIYLAKLIGPIYLVIGLGILLNRNYYRAVVEDVAANPALSYFTGVLALVAGGLIVILNNVWQGWPALITVLGWLAILKGVVRTIFPTQSASWAGRITENAGLMTAAGLVALVLGAYLTAMGYWLGPLG